MGEKIEYAIIILVFLIIYTIISFRFKNFIPELYSKMFFVVIYFMLLARTWADNGFINELFNSFYIFLLMTAAVVVFTMLKYNKIYYFKGIDKKLIKAKDNEISQILQYFKNDKLDEEASISIEKDRIIFSGLSKHQVNECLSLLGKYLNENREKYTIKDYLNYYNKTIALPAIITFAVIFIFIKILNYRSPIEVSEKVKINNEKLIGNTVGNINNYGLVAETNDSIYYVNDYKIFKTDKDLENEVIIFEERANFGKDTINVVEDWIFYRSGKDIDRIKTDGTNDEIVFKGYSLHMQVIGNWIYFISIEDDSKICKIDVNGQNKQFLSNKNIEDMAVYNGKIYFSYKDKENGFLEVMNMDGTNKQFLFNIRTRNMIIDDEFIYYLDDGEEILYRMSLKDKSKEQLSNQQILKFIKDDNFIYYTLKDPENSDWRFKGLYRMNVDGSNVIALDSEIYLDELGIGITTDYVFYVATNGKEQPSLKIINKDGIKIK